MAENFIHFYWPSSPHGAAAGPNTDTSSSPDQEPRDRSTCSPLLPSFETFCKENTNASVSSDQSTAGSESSFSIESLIRAASSVPRSSTPGVPRDPMLSQTWKNDNGKVDVKPTVTKKDYKRHDDKPPYTYVAMCIMAIETSPQKGLTQVEIREQLQRMFPFFNGSYTGWKESIRACLSRNKYFIKIKPDGESRQSLWLVDRTTLTPGMFKKQFHKGSGQHYKEFLHEELGVPSICSLLQKPTAAGSYSMKDMILPAAPCFQPSHTVTAESTCSSEDFLHARRDSGCEVEDESRITSPSGTSVYSEPTTTHRKRKLSLDKPDTVSKKSKSMPSDQLMTSNVVKGHTNSNQMSNVSYEQANTNTTAGYWNNYGYYQGNTYPNYNYYPYHNQYAFDQHRMQAYYPYHWQATNYNGQTDMSTPHNRQLVANHYSTMSHAAQVRYQAMFSGYRIAQQLLHRYQHRATHNSEEGDFQYDYRWYNTPSEDNTGIDLSATSSEAKQADE